MTRTSLSLFRQRRSRRCCEKPVRCRGAPTSSAATAATVDDPTTGHLAAQACTSMEQLVHHLMVFERQVQRGEKAAGRRAR